MGQYELPFDQKHCEDELKYHILDKLSPHFDIQQEVHGTQSNKGRNRRIDAVIMPKNTQDWANKNVKFGVEFKGSLHSEDTANVTKLLLQAIDYHYTDFDGLGRIPILICPLELPKGHESYLFKRFLGRLGIGEIRPMGSLGICIVFHESSVIWSEKSGVMEGRTNNFYYQNHH